MAASYLRSLFRGRKLRASGLVRRAIGAGISAFCRNKVVVIEGYEARDIVWWFPYVKGGLLCGFLDRPEPMLAVVLSRLRRDSVFVDVGAFLGLYSIFASRTAIDGKVYAFEANPRACDCLRRNAVANSRHNIIIENKAVLDRTGRVRFNVGLSHPRNSSIYEEVVKSGGAEAVEVDAVSLDHYFLKERAAERIDFVKIDGIGSELLIINGMRGVLERFRPSVLLEFYSLFNPAISCSDAGSMIATFMSYGYKVSLVSEWSGRVWSDAGWDIVRDLSRERNGRGFTDLLLEPA